MHRVHAWSRRKATTYRCSIVLGTDALPCLSVRPSRAIVGDSDHVLHTEGNGLAAIWEIDANLVDANPEATLEPTVINEARAHRERRAPGLRPGTALVDPIDVPAATPRRREWADCEGRPSVWWMRAQQNHPAFGLGNHTITNLEDDSDFVVRELIAGGFE